MITSRRISGKMYPIMPGSLMPTPFFTALALLAASQARASMDNVMWAYQARLERTW